MPAPSRSPRPRPCRNSPSPAVPYVCPVPAAREVLAGSDDQETAELAENPLIFPDGEMRKRLVVARDISSAESRSLARRWNAIAGL